MWSQFLQTNKNLPSSSEIDLSDLKDDIMVTELKQLYDDLKKNVEELTTRLAEQQPKIEQYEDIKVNVIQPNDVSLKIFETLPDFNGERDKYATWRSTTKIAMELLSKHPQSMRYFEALMIIRNKVKGPASNILNNYNTAFNFQAIIDRLDFTYADKRPLYVLEQELLVLQQNRSTIDEFYDKVNEKLNSIINKVNMTYKEKSIAIAFIESVNQKALRTFITGLNHKKGELLYASNPTTLPEAYARLQTINNDQERIYFANRYNNREKEKEGFQMRNPQFRYKEIQQPNWMKPNDQQFTNQFQRQEMQQPNWIKKDDQQPMNSHQSMDIDKSSIHVNVDKNFNPSKFNQSNQNARFNPAFKRNFSTNNQSRSASEQKQKQFRINNMQDEANYAKTILQDEQPEELLDEEFEFATTTSNDLPSSSSSIFLEE